MKGGICRPRAFLPLLTPKCLTCLQLSHARHRMKRPIGPVSADFSLWPILSLSKTFSSFPQALLLREPNHLIAALVGKLLRPYRDLQLVGSRCILLFGLFLCVRHVSVFQSVSASVCTHMWKSENIPGCRPCLLPCLIQGPLFATNMADQLATDFR